MVYINSNDAERRAIRHARFEIVLSLVGESLHRAAQFQRVAGHTTQQGGHITRQSGVVHLIGRPAGRRNLVHLSGRLAGRRDGRDGRIRMRNRCGRRRRIMLSGRLAGRRDGRDGRTRMRNRCGRRGRITAERPARWST